MNPLVSIIMPCYNGALYVERAVSGVINQSYRPIQLIVINDGSTDDSKLILQNLSAIAVKSNIQYKLINQENMGLGGAINTGLMNVEGKYLSWIDADDELLPLSIEKRVRFLESNPEFGSVSSDAYYVKDTDWNNPIGTVCYNKSLNQKENQFEEMLLGKSLFCAGCHLIRFDLFKKANGGTTIYPARHGQNWQLLLPIYYIAKHGFIDEPLYKYQVSHESMSGLFENGSVEAIFERRKEYLTLVKATLKRIQNLGYLKYRFYYREFKRFIFDCNIDTSLENENKMYYYYWVIVKKVGSII